MARGKDLDYWLGEIDRLDLTDKNIDRKIYQILDGLNKQKSSAIDEGIRELGFRLLKDVRENKFKALLEDSQARKIGERIAQAEYLGKKEIPGYTKKEAGGNVYFQFNRGEVFTDPDSGESNLREAFIHETGHNILEQYGGLFYKDIEGEIPQGYKNLHEFFAELFEVAYFGHVHLEKGKLEEHQWAFKHIQDIEKLLKSENKIGDFKFLGGLLKFAVKEIAKNVKENKTFPKT